ncbi:MAG: 16S rRNA (cytosine(1402)-N(4))-methyltransferase RsmH [Candidatus Pacebacteria bacterium]|nr:16S rRNA (cytosine(1402)-N(4))-methyltransferase RsmH [Candidatus Paceibacterota bacterium]
MRTLNNHSHSSTGSDQQRGGSSVHTVHIPVLLQEVLDNLQENLTVHTGAIVLDATLGGGGHAVAIAKIIGSSGTLIGIDADSVALKRAEHHLIERLQSGEEPTLHLVQDNFRNLDSVLDTLNIKELDAALFDLGFSSDQLEISGRGFTFQNDEPLTMTLSDIVGEETLTAKEIVNDWQEENIADIIYGYGGERYSRRIAKAIVEARVEVEITTTEQLVEIIKTAVPNGYRNGRTNPATKTFQALRITVNDELGAAKEALEKVMDYLKPGGKIAIITFHSLEDRLVKKLFKQWKAENKGIIITKKPITPTNEEIRDNKRARSSKLRVFQKEDNNKK